MKRFKGVISLAASAFLVLSLSGSMVAAGENNTAAKESVESVDEKETDAGEDTTSVFWDKSEGDDANDGLSEDAPVKSLERAGEIASEIDSATIVNMAGSELSESEQTLIADNGLEIIDPDDYEEADQTVDEEKEADSEEIQDSEDVSDAEEADEITEDTENAEEVENAEIEETADSIEETESTENTESMEDAGSEEVVEGTEDADSEEIQDETVSEEDSDDAESFDEEESEDTVMVSTDNSSNTPGETILQSSQVVSPNSPALMTAPAVTDNSVKAPEETASAEDTTVSEEESDAGSVAVLAIPGRDIVGKGTTSTKTTSQTDSSSQTASTTGADTGSSTSQTTPTQPATTPTAESTSAAQQSASSSSQGTVAPVNTGVADFMMVYVICILLAFGAFAAFTKVGIDKKRAAMALGYVQEIEDFRKACKLD